MPAVFINNVSRIKQYKSEEIDLFLIDSPLLFTASDLFGSFAAESGTIEEIGKSRKGNE